MIRISVVALLAALLANTAVGQTTKTPPAHAATAKPAADASNRFADEASAKAHCGSDTVVWLNTSSKVYHLAGTPSYGKTKKGAYTCQKDADQSGAHLAKGEAAKASTPTAPKKP
jgi:hypothetical protein